MRKEEFMPTYIFETSWEVCNKVGGIYTVLSTQAKTLQEKFLDHIFYVGPDLWIGKDNADFLEDEQLLLEWRHQAERDGISVRIGRWNIPGLPIVVLVNFTPLYEIKNQIYGEMWNDFRVDSIKAYGDYDEACMFSLAAGKFVESVYSHFIDKSAKVVYQAHEWMSGCGLLYIKKHCPKVGTIFTTHATSIGRSITTNNKPLYDYFNGYNGDQMAEELHMEAKHSIEKQAALNADCLTTVSHATDLECRQFFGRSSDVLLLNGFEEAFVPKGAQFTRKRKEARKVMIQVANQLMGTSLSPETTTILSTSGRNDFSCKGYDVLINAFARMQQTNLQQDVLAVIAVPCWKKGPREDLKTRLLLPAADAKALPEPYLTHDLYNKDEDRIVATLRAYQIRSGRNEHFHVMFVPSYLDGKDEIFNLTYYDWLVGNDFCLYPSYYEPWGYTCLESVAFGIPCLTTNLTGFGQWVNDLVGHSAQLEDGVAVVARSDSSYEQTAADIADTISHFLRLTPVERKEAGRNARKIARKALWKDFINNYYKAFAIALKNAAN